MPQLRTLICDIDGCECQSTEEKYGDGWDGWLLVSGMKIDQVSICPDHKLAFINLFNSLEESIKNDMG